jgi:hypothetical protein
VPPLHRANDAAAAACSATHAALAVAGAFDFAGDGPQPASATTAAPTTHAPLFVFIAPT